MPVRELALAACAATLSLCSEATAQDAGRMLLDAFPRGEEACYGRVYDAAHLARHPRQRMSAFHLFKSLTPDPMKEEGYRTPAAEIAHDRKETGARWLSVLVRFKDKPGKLYRQEVECQGNGEGFHCGRDCDGGGFAARASGGRLFLSQDRAEQGLRLAAACDPDEEGEGMRLDPKEDATSWTLERLQMSACHAERDAARPPWAKAAGPLSERWVDRGGVCHGRSYDAAHLGRHPEQKVVAVTLRTEDRVRHDGDIDDFSTFVPVRLSAKLRDGTVVSRTARCTARDYVFACHDQHDAFTLARAGDKGLLVRDVNATRTIDPQENFLAKFLRADLGDDDRVFRLDERDDPICDLGR
jgi:hypothetical protein